MMYIIILVTALACVGVATPLTILALKFLDKPTPTPIAPPEPAQEVISGPERVERIARGGRSVPKSF